MWLSIMIALVVTCLGVLITHSSVPAPLSVFRMNIFNDKISLTDEIIYGDVFSLGGGNWEGTNDSWRDIRVAIVYPFFWVILNANKRIYVLIDSETGSGNYNRGHHRRLDHNPCPNGQTFAKLNPPSSGLGMTNLTYRCLPFSLIDLIRRSDTAYEKDTTERVYFKFENILRKKSTSINIKDCINYLILRGLLTVT